MARVTLMVPFDPLMGASAGNNTMPPLRLALLAGSCRAAGHDTHVIDGVGLGLERRWVWGDGFHLEGLGFDELIERIPSGTQVLGLSMMFSQSYPPVRALLREIRRRRPELVMVAGGEGMTGIADLAVREAELDGVVVGEGEAPLLDVIEAIERGEGAAGLDAIANLVTLRRPSAVAVNPRAKGRFEDPDRIPAADWSDVPLERYWQSNRMHGVNLTGRFIPMVATRGCPYRCQFCTAPGTWGMQRYLSHDEVARQIEHYRAEYGVEHIVFNDLSLSTSHRWFEGFVDRLNRITPRITWSAPSGIRAERMSVDLLRHAKESGLAYLQISPETGSEQVMSWIDKRMSIDSVLETVRNAKAVDLPVGAAFVVGYPVETWGDLVDTFRLTARLVQTGLHEAVMSLFQPLPGSPSFQELRAANRVTMDDRYFRSLFVADLTMELSHNPRMTGRELRIVRLFFYLWLFLNVFGRSPRRLVTTIFNAASGRQTHKLDRILRRDFAWIVKNYLTVLTPTGLGVALKMLRNAWTQPQPGWGQRLASEPDLAPAG